LLRAIGGENVLKKGLLATTAPIFVASLSSPICRDNAYTGTATANTSKDADVKGEFQSN